MHSDDLEIPSFLRRQGEAPRVTSAPVRRREKKIPYPKDGYACKGKRQRARELHRDRLRRDAERMRQR